eukprot:Amastigsp_a848199_6.p2 type:complete len:308 gc:universal Amastigsp_a848199_6:1-924(+)
MLHLLRLFYELTAPPTASFRPAPKPRPPYNDWNAEIYNEVSTKTSVLKDPRAHADYHRKYREARAKWDSVPAVNIANEIAERIASRLASYEIDAKNPLVVVDLGCGDSLLARHLLSKNPQIPVHIIQIDHNEEKNAQDPQSSERTLKAAPDPLGPHVVSFIQGDSTNAADLIPSGTQVDIVVLCLAMMNHDPEPYLRAAHTLLSRSSSSPWRCVYVAEAETYLGKRTAKRTEFSALQKRFFGASDGRPQDGSDGRFIYRFLSKPVHPAPSSREHRFEHGYSSRMCARDDSDDSDAAPDRKKHRGLDG